MNGFDPKLLEEIQKQFEQIKESENFVPDKEYQKELEDSWMQSLRKKYPIKRNQAEINKLYKNN